MGGGINGMKCKDCPTWWRRREDFNIAEQWDACAKYNKDVLTSFAKLIPGIREQLRQHELLRDTECPTGRCILCQS